VGKKVNLDGAAFENCIVRIESVRAPFEAQAPIEFRCHANGTARKYWYSEIGIFTHIKAFFISAVA
jgi:hypothetical protein